MEIWQEYYHWEIEFQNGTISELIHDSLSKEKRIDFNSPPSYLGDTISIKLISHKESFPPLLVKLDGRKPVYFRRNNRTGDMKLNHWIFFIGSNNAGYRKLLGINSATKEVVLEEDLKG